MIFNSLAALLKFSLQDRVEFNEGDIGLTGGIQILEPANLNPITSESQPQGRQNQTVSLSKIQVSTGKMPQNASNWHDIQKALHFFSELHVCLFFET